MTPAPRGELTVQVRCQGRLGEYASGLRPHCRRTLKIAGRELGLGADNELSVLLCDSPTIRRLNRRWRAIDRPTDVLSFPTRRLGPGERPPNGPIGDIVVALPVARREARARRRTLGFHLSHLLIHGLLHLLGSDHQSASEARRMEAEENQLLELVHRL